jgi:hypothetical protein
MALIKCKECGAEVSNSAKTCPKCGAPMPKKTSLLTWLALFLILLIGYSISNSTSNSGTTKNFTAGTSESTPLNPTSTPVPVKPKSWSYQNDVDKMSGKESKYAQTASINTHELHFPYQGGTNMTITLRRHPRMGLDAFISINKGQLDTNYNGTTVSVKFDDKPPMKFSMNEPDDNSRDTLFFNNQKRFIENIKKSKHVIIEAQFFQDGNRQFEFNTDGLEWK